LAVAVAAVQLALPQMATILYSALSPLPAAVAAVALEPQQGMRMEKPVGQAAAAVLLALLAPVARETPRLYHPAKEIMAVIMRL
jgi:hypothetical protein